MAAQMHPRLSRFFFHMVHTFCIPGRRVEVKEFFFHEDRSYNNGIGYARVTLAGGVTREYFEWLEPELRMGLTSSYHANRVLEMQGLPAGDKPMLVHERLSDFIYRFPDKFDFDLFSLKQSFFNSVSDSFKSPRRLSHLSRLIISAYAMRRRILDLIDKTPGERQLLVKIIPARLNLPLEEKRVMGVLVGAHLMKEREVLGKRHLLQTVRRILPQIKDVDESSLEWREGPLRWIYIEFEKEPELEKKKLQNFLESQLKHSVEKLMRSVFMPRNEEEVMKNLVMLSHQIKFVDDLPQMIVSFDGQTESDLIFNITLVRLLRPRSKPYEELPMHVDRRRIMGTLRKKYPKEALVLRMSAKAEPFLREDQSIDLLTARADIVEKIEEVFGEVRDFNGGMFSKQNEAISKLKRVLADVSEVGEITIENFFHAIFPVEMRACIQINLAKKLFLLLKTSRDKVTCDVSDGQTFIIIRDISKEQKQKILAALARLSMRREELVTIRLPHHLGVMGPKNFRQDLLNTVHGIMI